METAMNDPAVQGKPPLVLVGGSPGSGKTTLATALADHLALPLLRKDTIKERLHDALREAGSPEAVRERHASKRLGWAAIRLLYAQAGDLLTAGCGCIVESNFNRGISERDLAPLLAMSDARLIHCEAPDGLLLDRYRARHEAGERHPAHVDGEAMEDFRRALAAGSFAPLDLTIPVLRVSTIDGYQPGFEAIVGFAEASF